MRIGIMIITEGKPDHYGVAWDKFNEKTGYGRKELAKLYKEAKANLHLKVEFFKKEAK